MAEKIGKILRGQIVTSIIYVLLGLCLVCMPVESVNLICKLVFGIVMIVAGVYHVLIYVMEKMNSTVLDLFSGAILIVLGGFLFFNPQVVIKLLPTLLGTFVLIDSIWTVKGAFRLRKRSRGTWKLLLIGSLIFIGFGIAMVVNPFTVVRYTIMFAGWILLCNGILDFVFLIVLRRGLRELKETVEEAVELENAVDADAVVVPDSPENTDQSSEKTVDTASEIKESPEESTDLGEEPSDISKEL